MSPYFSSMLVLYCSTGQSLSRGRNESAPLGGRSGNAVPPLISVLLYAKTLEHYVSY